MASDLFCDREPCSWMKKFVAQFLIRNREKVTFKEGTFGVVQVLLLSRPKKNGTAPDPMKVTLWYCPFCGTRLKENKYVLEWIDSKMGVG